MADQPLPREADEWHDRDCGIAGGFPHAASDHAPTPPIEPEAEPLTDEELADYRRLTTLLGYWPRYLGGDTALGHRRVIATIDRLTERVEKARWLAEQDSCTIDRLTRERDEALEQATVWNAAWAELARKQIGPIA